MSNPRDREARAGLEAERRRTTQRLGLLLAEHDGFVTASRDSNADDEHDPEGTTIAFERSQVDSLTRQAGARLEQIEAAFERLAAGRYGTCDACGRPISSQRLRARPSAATCMVCA